MTDGPGLSDQLPIGRRLAYWRRQRRMSQQVFADRIGRSKSWIDKVERGVRRLDRMSVLRELADALRITLPQLVGAPVQADDRVNPVPGVAAVRATLSRYEVPWGRRPATVPDVEELERAVSHAWAALARADYDRLLRSLPDLITGGQWCRTGQHPRGRAGQDDGRADQQNDGRIDGRDWRPGVLLGQVYQIAAEALGRLGEFDAAWLAADRAMAVSADAGDPLWAARAAVPLAAVLRETGRNRHGFEMCVIAAHRIAGPDPLDGAAEYLSVYGTLLLHAARAAAVAGQRASAGELLDQARSAAYQVGAGRDHYRTHFGPGLVGVAEATVAVELGHGEQALTGQPEQAADPDHQRLPAAVRAAYLIDVARAHLQAGDPVRAGRALLAAEGTATAEVRLRPAAREVLGAVLRQTSQPEPPVVQLAEAIGVTV